MSSGQGSAQNLSHGSQEAFKALINSIAPEITSQTNGNKKLTTEAVQKLSEKIKELVGEDAVKDFEHHRNERGELLNEEGLPIIDITEPVNNAEDRAFENPSIIDDVPLINLNSIPSVAKEKLRQQRDRILDMLEEEEKMEAEREERTQREEREAIMRKRKDDARNEKERMQKAKLLQKKMGKALLNNMGPPDNKEFESGGTDPKPDSQHREGRKKTVTFVETDDEPGKPDWGDVTAARLRSGQRPTLMQALRPNHTPVKLSVVERKPMGQSRTDSNTTAVSTPDPRDSDDESEPEANSDYQHMDSSDDGDNDETTATEEPLGNEEEDGEFELETEFDLNFAQHQREVALEYYKKRNTIGQEAAKAMMDHVHEEEENETTIEVPSPNEPKPSVSRFKANRIASAYGASVRTESTSLAGSVVPESTARTIQQAIRSGRIDDDQKLVGGDHDSDSEAEVQGLQDTLELLRKGQVYNTGPDGEYLHIVPPTNLKTPNSKLTGPSAMPPSTQIQETPASLPPLNRPKFSKFKADHTLAGRPSAGTATSTPPTPISRAVRSSPKLLLAEMVLEKNRTGNNTLEPSNTNIRIPSLAQPLASMIVESPSFPSPSNGSVNHVNYPSSMQTVDSPSFPSGQRMSTSRPSRPPEIISTKRSEARVGAVSASNSSMPMAPVVQERVTPRVGSGNAETAPKKMSRFKMERQEQY